MSTVSAERVLVVPARLLHEAGYFQGFCRAVEPYLKLLLAPEHGQYRPRSQVEEDPTFKQLIPYVILRSGDQVFSYTRGKTQGEARLHALRSIGVGGHISADDRNLFDPSYQEAMHRELAEEVQLDSPYREQCVGLINDDSTPVGRVHLGIVHLFDLETPAVKRRERGLAEARFVPIADLRRDLDQFETWSQICIRELFA